MRPNAYAEPHTPGKIELKSAYEFSRYDGGSCIEEGVFPAGTQVFPVTPFSLFTLANGEQCEVAKVLDENGYLCLIVRGGE